MDTDRRYDGLRDDDDNMSRGSNYRDDDNRGNRFRDDDDTRMSRNFNKTESSGYDDSIRDYGNTNNPNQNRDQEKVLFYLDELSDYKVASDYKDVRGWEVVDSQDRTIGEVDDLLVNKNTERVVYLDVEVDDELAEQVSQANERPASEGTHHFVNEDGENHVIVPIGTVDIDEDNKKVYARDIEYEKFLRAKWIRKGTPIDRDYEMRTLRDYFPEGFQGGDWRGDDTNFYDRREFQQRRYRS